MELKYEFARSTIEVHRGTRLATTCTLLIDGTPVAFGVAFLNPRDQKDIPIIGRKFALKYALRKIDNKEIRTAVWAHFKEFATEENTNG